MKEPAQERAHPAGMGGVQRLYEFQNGYGASVVRFFGSYGHEDGKWELAVLKYSAPGDYELTYDTPITNDVLGWLSDEQVDSTLAQIEALTPHTVTVQESSESVVRVRARISIE